VRAVAISPDGARLATASNEETVRIWHADGSPRATLSHTRRVRAVAISPDGAWLVTASSDGTVRIWDADGAPRATLTGHTNPVNAVAISPDGAWLATASSDRTLRIWDAATGQIAAMMRVEDGLYACAWIGPSGLAAGGAAGVYVFDFLTGPARKT
jgi:WD40 repeat protein